MNHLNLRHAEFFHDLFSLPLLLILERLFVFEGNQVFERRLPEFAGAQVAAHDAGRQTEQRHAAPTHGKPHEDLLRGRVVTRKHVRRVERVVKTREGPLLKQLDDTLHLVDVLQLIRFCRTLDASGDGATGVEVYVVEVLMKRAISYDLVCGGDGGRG